MKTSIMTANDFVRGNPEKQDYFKQGRSIREVARDEIDSYCDCGYLTLKPTNDFENFNGGLTVKRANVKICDENGNLIKKLRSRKGSDGYDDIMKLWQCNACGNDWK